MQARNEKKKKTFTERNIYLKLGGGRDEKARNCE